MGGDHFLNLQPGTIINGRYEVVKCLGAGSMGMVYACRHRELAGHIVAMKVLFAEVARDEVAAARFRNEIVASYGVSHPNVVRAYEYFRDGDLIAFTMEYIGGGDLADRIANDEEISIPEIITMLCQMASGVQAIHDAGIIHRDLKPENILLTSQGNIKITDFGIARMGTGPKLTEHGGVVGTIDYVSPEYLERGQVDARSDIYALGVLAYEMITGESPFKGKSVIETMTMRLRTNPEPPHHLRMDCPVALSNIVLKAMARDPVQRYQSAAEMLEDLEELRDAKKNSRPKSNKAPVREQREVPREQAVHPASEETEVPAENPVLEEDNRAEARPIQTRSDTLQLSASQVAAIKEASDEDDDDAFDHHFPMESVLRRSEELPSSPPWVEERAMPSVGVSQSSLSLDRMKELSRDLYPAHTGFLRTVLYWLFVGFVGFGVGMLLVKHFDPELFDAAEHKLSSAYTDTKVRN